MVNFHPYYDQLSIPEKAYVDSVLRGVFHDSYRYEYVMAEPDKANDLEEAFAKWMLGART